MGAKRPEPPTTKVICTTQMRLIAEAERDDARAERDELRRQLAESRERERKLRDALIAIGLAAGEQQRKGEPMIHAAIIDVVKFALDECKEGEDDG